MVENLQIGLGFDPCIIRHMHGSEHVQDHLLFHDTPVFLHLLGTHFLFLSYRYRKSRGE